MNTSTFQRDNILAPSAGQIEQHVYIQHVSSSENRSQPPFSLSKMSEYNMNKKKKIVNNYIKYILDKTILSFNHVKRNLAIMRKRTYV